MYPIGKWPPPPILPFVPVVSIVDSRMQIGELGELLPVDKTALVQVFISKKIQDVNIIYRKLGQCTFLGPHHLSGTLGGQTMWKMEENCCQNTKQHWSRPP